MRFIQLVLISAALAVGVGGCGDKKAAKKAPAEGEPGKGKRVDSRPPPMARPVPLWEKGKQTRDIDAATAAERGYVLVDLGEHWTPYLFSLAEGQEPPAYRDTYLRLARGEFPDNHHGERAREDKYLELYGIMPTLTLLRQRIAKMRARECINSMDLAPLQAFDGFVAYRRENATKQKQRNFLALERRVKELLKDRKAESADALPMASLSQRDQARVNQYIKQAPAVHAIRAAQDRLECEGYFKGLGRYLYGVLDWRTHEALARFERRHRVYAWGYIGRESLAKLQQPTLELERQAVIRVLTERAMHSAGVIEDGSTSTLHNGEARTFTTKSGKQERVPDLETELRQHVIDAFGLHTPESTVSWLEALGKIGKEKTVAIKGPPLPSYYDGDMDLYVEIDKGDVWYDFPFDDEGKERPQPVQRRPKLTLFVKYNNQRIPLVRYGTTIGGWRSDYENGHVLWRYKDSPVGPRVWKRIVAAPVWLPPESTPPRDLLQRSRKRGQRYEVDYHEMGPSYASAYGLVAAYHEKFHRYADGTVAVGGDEGIRTHGSVDYMSIARRHSHGCHRLHNHLAVRLMSFVLAHRPHKRIGQKRVFLDRDLPHEDEVYTMSLREGGYDFELQEPVVVNVTEGRVRGQTQDPITRAIPKYDEEIGAYVTPDGGAVAVSRSGKLTDIPLPEPEEEELRELTPTAPGQALDPSLEMVPTPGAY